MKSQTAFEPKKANGIRRRLFKLQMQDRCPVCGGSNRGDWCAKSMYQDGDELCWECGLWALEFDTWNETYEIVRSISFSKLTAGGEGFSPPSDRILGYMA